MPANSFRSSPMLVGPGVPTIGALQNARVQQQLSEGRTPAPIHAGGAVYNPRYASSELGQREARQNAAAAPANDPGAYAVIDSVFGRRQGRGYPEDMSQQQALLELLEGQFPLDRPNAGFQMAAATTGRGVPRFQNISDAETESVAAGQGMGSQALQELLSRIDYGTYGLQGVEPAPPSPNRFTAQQKLQLKQAARRLAEGR